MRRKCSKLGIQEEAPLVTCEDVARCRLFVTKDGADDRLLKVSSQQCPKVTRLGIPKEEMKVTIPPKGFQRSSSYFRSCVYPDRLGSCKQCGSDNETELWKYFSEAGVTGFRISLRPLGMLACVRNMTSFRNADHARHSLGQAFPNEDKIREMLKLWVR